MPGMEERHRQRRKDVSDAAWEVIVKDGLHGASLRAIARKLNCTTGVVMHYFRSRDELMLFALDRLFTRHENMVNRGTKNYEGAEKFRHIVYISIPTDARTELGWRIWLAFLGYAVGHPKLMKEHKRRNAHFRNFLIRELKILRSKKLLRANLDLNFEAEALVALVNGIAIGRIVDRNHMHPEGVWEIVDRHLERILKS